MKKMTKTNGKYTYEDLLLRKRVLKQEIQEIERMAMIENLPKTLGLIGGNMKDKAVELIKNPNTMGLLIDTGLGIGAERIISRFVNKKSIAGQVALLASVYLIPFAINKTKELIVKLSDKKNKIETLDDQDYEVINEK